VPTGGGMFRYETLLYFNSKILIHRKEKLPEGSTAAPLIISTDKTQLSHFSGDKQAWPVYLSIGNINKETR
jgi:hypothetical protein